MSRFLLTTDAVGGVWTYTLDLARAWRDLGHDTTIATMGPRPTEAQRRAAEDLALVETDFPLEWTAESPGELHAIGRDVAALAARLRADALHLHSPALATGVGGVPAVAVAHSCVGTWWATVGDGPMPRDLAWRAAAMREGMGRAAQVIAPSHAFARALNAAYPGAPSATVVRNGRRWTAAPAARVRSGAITAGRLWDRGKNARALDAVSARLRVPIAAIGPTRHGDECFEPARMTHLGTRDAAGVAAAFSAHRAFVSLALYEPFGLAVLEAAQAGLALVLSDIPTHRELWDGAALFVDPADTETAAIATLTALDDDGTLGARAFEKAHAYSIEAMAEATLRVHAAARAIPAQAA